MIKRENIIENVKASKEKIWEKFGARMELPIQKIENENIKEGIVIFEVYSNEEIKSMRNNAYEYLL